MPYLWSYIGLRTGDGPEGASIRPGGRLARRERRGASSESEQERQASRRRGSGEGEEQLLHLLLGQRGIGVAGQALPHPARHDLEPGPVKGAGYRGKLRDHLGAV